MRRNFHIHRRGVAKENLHNIVLFDVILGFADQFFFNRSLLIGPGIHEMVMGPISIQIGHLPGFETNVGAMAGMGRGGNLPKGDIQKLWKALGIRIDGSPGFDRAFRPNLVWQQYNPYPRVQIESAIPDEWIFASNRSPGGRDSISPSSQVTSGLDEVLFPVPGYFEKRPESKFDFLPLIQTGTQSGTITDEGYMRARQNPVSST